MNPARIFLDLDDVLNKFTQFALAAVGCGTMKQCYEKYPIEAGYDIVKAATMLHPEKKFTPERFWGNIGIKVWQFTPRSDEFDRLIGACEEYVGRENVFVVTTATKDSNCVAGKYDWIKWNCPEWLHRQFFICGPHKYVAARPDSLLIDDSNENVGNWRVAGGQALLMPRPWNPMYRYDPASIFDNLQKVFE